MSIFGKLKEKLDDWRAERRYNTVRCDSCNRVIGDRNSIRRQMESRFGSVTVGASDIKCPYCGATVFVMW